MLAHLLHQQQHPYAFAHLLDIVLSKTTKPPKRFLCSTILLAVNLNANNNNIQMKTFIVKTTLKTLELLKGCQRACKLCGGKLYAITYVFNHLCQVEEEFSNAQKS